LPIESNKLGIRDEKSELQTSKFVASITPDLERHAVPALAWRFGKSKIRKPKFDMLGLG
jgi:hypothetical protein